VLTTGTGSGKSLAYMVPIVDYALRNGPGDGRIKAIVVYPMNLRSDGSTSSVSSVESSSNESSSGVIATTDAGLGSPLVVVDPLRGLIADARLARHVQVSQVLVDDRPELVDRDGLCHGHHPLDRFDAREHAGGGPTDGRQLGETDGR
jgi:hypothetical protein